MINEKKFGIAFGGGGARGIAHIGVARVLLEADLKPDFLAGSSMGALVAAFLASGHDWEKVEALALSLNKSRAAKLFLEIGKKGQALIGGKKVSNFLSEQIGDISFADLEIPLAVVACDLANGQEVVIRHGLVREAIMASIAVPGIFPPCEYEGKILVDGGVVNPTPVDVVKKMGADVVLGVDLISRRDRELSKIPNLIDTLLLSYEIIRLKAMEEKLHKNHRNMIIVMPEKREIFDSFRFFDTKEFIRSGETSMYEALPKLRKKLGIAK
jgi:NTE family protein